MGKRRVLNGYSSTRVSLWDSLMFGRLAMGFANVRAGTRVLMLVLVQAWPVDCGQSLLGSARTVACSLNAGASPLPPSPTRAQAPAQAPALVLEYPPEH